MQDMIHIAEMALAMMMAVSILSFVFAGFKCVTAQGDPAMTQQAIAQIMFNGIGVAGAGGATIFLHMFKYRMGINTTNEVSDFSTMFGWVVILVFFVGVLYVILSYLLTNEKETKNVQEIHVTMKEKTIIELATETQAQAIEELEQTLHYIRQKYV